MGERDVKYYLRSQDDIDGLSVASFALTHKREAIQEETTSFDPDFEFLIENGFGISDLGTVEFKGKKVRESLEITQIPSKINRETKNCKPVPQPKEKYNDHTNRASLLLNKFIVPKLRAKSKGIVISFWSKFKLKRGTPFTKAEKKAVKRMLEIAGIEYRPPSDSLAKLYQLVVEDIRENRNDYGPEFSQFSKEKLNAWFKTYSNLAYRASFRLE